MRKKIIYLVLAAALCLGGCGQNGIGKQSADAEVFQGMSRQDILASVRDANRPAGVLEKYGTVTSTETVYTAAGTEYHMRLGIDTGLFAEYFRTPDRKNLYTIEYQGEVTESDEEGVYKVLYLDPEDRTPVKDLIYPFWMEDEADMTVTSSDVNSGIVALTMETDSEDLIAKWAKRYSEDPANIKKVTVVNRFGESDFLLHGVSVNFLIDGQTRQVMQTKIEYGKEFKYLDKIKDVYSKMYSSEQHTLTVGVGTPEGRKDELLSAGEGCAFNIYFSDEYEPQLYSDERCTQPIDASELASYKDGKVYIKYIGNGGAGESVQRDAQER